MNSARRVAVVIPARNVGPVAASVVRGLPELVDDVVAVDDASTDDTGAHLAALAARMRGRLDVVTLATRQGVGGAIGAGYARAFERGAGVVAVMAGDGQMDPRDLETLIAPILSGAADYAVGDRLTDPTSRAQVPWPRRMAFPVFAALTRWASGYPQIRDSQCGYTAVSRNTLEILLAQGFWAGYGVPNDLLCRLGALGARVVVVPVRALYPPGVRSGLRPWHVLLTIPWVIVRGAYLRRRGRTRGVGRRYFQAPGLCNRNRN